jgi:antitoxin VapB
MALSIKDPEVDALARELAARTGVSITEAVLVALREQLARERAKALAGIDLAEALMEIGRRCAALPLLDDRPPDEILYDEHGLPR